MRKLLGLSGGPSEVKVSRPAAIPTAPPARDVRSVLIKRFSAASAILGFVGLSFEMYLYLIPAASRSHAPSAGVLIASILLLAGGIFNVKRPGKE